MTKFEPIAHAKLTSQLDISTAGKIQNIGASAMKNYTLSDETKTTPWGTVLHRIVATTTFTLACGLTVTEGDVGGWIEKESNLSGGAWVSDNAMVYDNARVYDKALVSGYAQVRGDAWVSDNARVRGNALVYENARVRRNAQVYGNAHVYGNGRVSGNAQVYGDAWVSGNTLVRGNALVSDNAQVYGDAWVCGDVHVYGNAKVSGNTKVFDNARVCGNARVSGDALIYGDAEVTNVGDYIIFKNNWSSGRYFTWTKSNDMWAVGCFYGTGDELIKNAYAASEASGKRYEVYVKLVETLKNVE